RDPLLRTSFLNCAGYVLCSTGHYEEALALLEQFLQEASDSRLAFILPYARLASSSAHTGLRNFGRASTLLSEVQQIGIALDDRYVSAEAETRMARLQLSQQVPERAIWHGTDEELPITKGERGEHLVTQALAYACLGDARRAVDFAAEAETTTASPQVRVHAPALRAVFGLQQGDRQVDSLVDIAFLAVTEIGEVDSFVCAYRAYPRLAAAVSTRQEWVGKLAEIMRRARD